MKKRGGKRTPASKKAGREVTEAMRGAITPRGWARKANAIARGDFPVSLVDFWVLDEEIFGSMKRPGQKAVVPEVQLSIKTTQDERTIAVVDWVDATSPPVFHQTLDKIVERTNEWALSRPRARPRRKEPILRTAPIYATDPAVGF